MTNFCKLYSSLPVIPFIAHWLLPEGIEQKMYIDLLGIPFFIPNISYFIYIIYYNKICESFSRRFKKQLVGVVLLLLTILYIYTLLISFINDIDNLPAILVNNQSFIYFTFLFLLFPLPSSLIKYTKYVIIPALIIICMEVILFSLGIMTYTEELGTQEFGGVLRISTTVGASTGTSVTLVMMGVLVLSCYRLKTYSLFIFMLLVSISILLTISRGSIIVWFLFLLVYIYKRYFLSTSLKAKVKTLICLFLGIFIIVEAGFVAPLLSRNEATKDAGNITSNRDVLTKSVLDLFNNSSGFGIGSGQTNVDRSLLYIVKQSNHIGVHNYYLSTLAEIGFPGLILVVSIIILLLLNLNFGKLSSYYVVMLFIITLSTEPMFTNAEFMAPTMFLLSVSLNRQAESNNNLSRKKSRLC